MTPQMKATNTRFSSLDRRRFLRGTGVALALPWFESFADLPSVGSGKEKRKRLACFYMPDGADIKPPDLSPLPAVMGG